MSQSAEIRRPYARRHPARPTERQLFVASFVRAGVPAAEADAAYHRLTRVWRRLRAQGRRASVQRTAQLTNMVTRPLLARYAGAA